MRNNSYQKLISHVTKREWVDATEIFRSIVEQKIALRLEAEKKLLTEPEDEVDEDCGEPGCPKDEIKEAIKTKAHIDLANRLYNAAHAVIAAKPKWQNRDFGRSFDSEVDDEYERQIKAHIKTHPKDEAIFYEATETQKCKSCGKSFAPHNGEYARCKECFDKQTDAGERASYGRF